jgi:tetraprenyl-beta-curcumene synthase
LLSARQLRALVRAATRELAWGLAAVDREVDTWRSLARTIPDAPLRQDALSALGKKRGQTDGAALLWTLPRTRNRSLLRTLVAYQIAWDFLDSANEHGVTAGQVNGRQLHLALIDALDQSRQISDYYLYHPWREDGSYLRNLVEACRKDCASLPSFARIQPFVVREAGRAQVLGINHELDPARRDADLEEWATSEFPTGHEATWFELTGAASAGLTIFAMLALASDSACTDTDVDRVRSVYFPWIATTATMLDSYVDQVEDAVNEDHRYVVHYRTPAHAARRICELIRRCLDETQALPDGERHTVVVACMVAMYLSKDATSPAMRATIADFVGSGGALTHLVLPILRLWRIAYGQRST